MDILGAIRGHALALPMMAIFALAMAIFAGIPRLSRAASLPGVVGLLLCGIVFGPHGIDVFGANPAVADFFSDLGKLLLMFFAGLEIDLQLLRRARNRSVIFGLATTLLPMAFGTFVGVLFGYGVIPALVIGSLLASHTLLGLTIVRETGQSNREAMTVAVGATVISDTVSLIIFAACVSAFVSGFSLAGLGVQMMEIAGFCAIILFGLHHAGGWLLRRTEHEEAAYFVILLVLLAAASVMAELIQLPGIIGAFLAGLALNSTVKDKPATSKLDFVGKTLFIPAFFIVTGFLIDPVAFFGSLLHQLPLVISIFIALLLGKWAAAALIGEIFCYTLAER
jgi:Kef-type K+ transport system membrane component KefB